MVDRSQAKHVPTGRTAALAGLGLFVAVVAAALCGPAVAAATAPPSDPAVPTTSTAPGPPASVPGPTVPTIPDDAVVQRFEMPALLPPGDPQAPVVPSPPGCAAAPTAIAVFEATAELVVKDFARFRVHRVLDGTLDAFAVGDRVDLYYGLDADFLKVGDRYIIGAAVDPDNGRLASRVKPDTPMFGGDAVIGLDDSDLDCPIVVDPVITLRADGSEVDAGLLVPLRGSGGRLAAAVGRPLAIAAAILLSLVVLKHLAFAVAASIRDAGRQPVVSRRR